VKHSIMVGIAGLLVASCKSGGGAHCDMSTKASVAATFKQVTGKDVSPDCSEISKTFPGIAMVGIFANDRGCITQGMLVDCKPPTDGYEAVAMARAGWATADLAGKQKLALAWLAEIDGVSIVTSKPEKFPKELSAPTAKAEGATLVIDFWTVDPAGMEPVMVYRKHHVVFAADGNPGQIDETDRVDVR
jgi:hypothetical protein